MFFPSKNLLLKEGVIRIRLVIANPFQIKLFSFIFVKYKGSFSASNDQNNFVVWKFC